jgi:hypothetical protein
LDTVLGLSVTPSAVGLVLVEGQDADGPTMDRDGFEVRSRHRPSPLQTCEQAAAAVLRTEAIATSRGHRLHSIGVTWSDDADTEAALLLRSLTESGFDNVVPVRLPEATEALAWGIAEVIGHETTAVCVIEPETVIVLIVHTGEGAVQTAVNRAIDSEEHLVQWLSAVFTRADWQPEALVVVGSGGDLEALMPWLEDALSVPVFAPAEAELALARGAALASAHNADFAFSDDAPGTKERRSGDRRRPLAQTGPLALLVAGVLTFVVSLSVAISLQLTPKKDARTEEARPAANTSAEAPAAATPPQPVAVPAPVAVTPLAPPPEAPPIEIAPPPVEVPVEQPEAPVVVADAPPVDPAVPLAPAPLDPAVPPPAAPPPPLPGQIAPPPVAPQPVERPGILTRLRDRLSDIGPDDEVPPGETLPPAPPPPLTVLPPP